jgi:hypothetical protein
MGRVHSYRVVLPKPWIRIPVGQGTQERVRRLVEETTREVPKEMPPDQVGPMRRELEHRLINDIMRSREYGGVDFYLPAGPQHGLLIGASFVVSQIRPPGQLPEELDPDQAVGSVLAELLSQSASATAEMIAGQAWVRSRKVLAPDPDRAPGVDVPMVAVSYTTALPDDPAKWVLVEFSGTGDGDPDSESTALIVDLFDAIMSTWRWIDSEDAEWAEGTGTVSER